MAKFDLKGMLSERSTKEMDIPEQKTVYRNPEDLIPSEDNFYSTEDTEKLKQSIKCLGILQPLLIENRDGKDYIIAGHSRRKCCLELIEEGEERFRKVPCVYKPKIELPGEEDEIIRKILIIQSNTYREKSDWEKMMESLKMESLVKELREKTELEGKTREIVSDLIGVSSTQIGRYHSISSNLSERLMKAFKQSKLNISTAAELAGLNEKYQAEACKILEETGQVTLNAAKLLKAQQEQERELPGQMTIEEALHPTKPQEIDTVIPVDIQIDRFYEALRKNVETYIRQSDRNMTIYMLSALYGSVRVRNGHLNYQGKKEGILFNPGSDQEKLVSWKDFSERLIAKYGKKKPVKTVSVIEKETQNNISGPAKCITGQSGSGQCGAAAYCDKGYNCCTQCPDDCNGRCGWIESCQPAAEPQDKKQQSTLAETEAVKAFCEAFPGKLKTIMKICRMHTNNGDAAKEVQKTFAPYGWHSHSGSKVGYVFEGFQNGVTIDTKDGRAQMKYGRLIKEIKNIYDPYSPEFDGDEEKTGKCTHRPEYDCTLQEAQKLAEGDGKGCNEKCCWNCKMHRSCTYECNASAHRPEESCQPAAEPQDEKQHDSSDHTDDPAEMLPENWPEYLRDIPIPTETALASYLYDQERDLKQILDIEKKEPGLPHMTIMQQQMVVAGLRILQNYIENTKEPEQPPLPEMKNNDQRKEWLRNHKSWGLWYTDPHTEARYYKYDFNNGARLIAEEYDPELKNDNSWWVPTESCYLHLVGGPEPERAGGVPKWTYHPKYNKFPNSETELVEFLKEIQK